MDFNAVRVIASPLFHAFMHKHAEVLTHSCVLLTDCDIRGSTDILQRPGLRTSEPFAYQSITHFFQRLC